MKTNKEMTANLRLCECYANGDVPGMLFPTAWDTLGDSEDGRVFITRHDVCGVFTSDYAAAQFVAALTGWEIHYQAEAFDGNGDLGRPCFKITLADANAFVLKMRSAG